MLKSIQNQGKSTNRSPNFITFGGKIETSNGRSLFTFVNFSITDSHSLWVISSSGWAFHNFNHQTGAKGGPKNKS